MKRFLLGLSLLAGVMLTPLASAQTPSVPSAVPVITQTTDATATTASADNSPQFAFWENLTNASEAVNFILILIAAGLMISIIRQYGSDAQLSGVFGYFLAGAFVLGLSRFIIFLSGVNILPLADHTLELAWHMIFYISMITFFIGGVTIAALAKNENKMTSLKKTFGWDAFLAVYIIIIVTVVELINVSFDSMYGGSLFDRIGLFHLVAFVTGGLAAFYLFQRARIGRVTSVIATPILLSFLLLAGEHLWELLHESWQVIGTNPDSLGDFIEELFVLPSSMLIIYAFMRLKKLISNPVMPAPMPAAQPAQAA